MNDWTNEIIGFKILSGTEGAKSSEILGHRAPMCQITFTTDRNIVNLVCKSTPHSYLTSKRIIRGDIFCTVLPENTKQQTRD